MNIYGRPPNLAPAKAPAAAAIVAARRRRRRRTAPAGRWKNEPDATQQAELKRTASALMPVSLGFHRRGPVLFQLHAPQHLGPSRLGYVGVSPRAESYRNAESFFRLFIFVAAQWPEVAQMRLSRRGGRSHSLCVTARQLCCRTR